MDFVFKWLRPVRFCARASKAAGANAQRSALSAWAVGRTCATRACLPDAVRARRAGVAAGAQRAGRRGARRERPQAAARHGLAGRPVQGLPAGERARTRAPCFCCCEAWLEDTGKTQRCGGAQQVPGCGILAGVVWGCESGHVLRLGGACMCAQEDDEIPRDWMTLFDTSLFKFDASLIPDAVALYDKLNIKKAPLSLIPPQVGVWCAHACTAARGGRKTAVMQVLFPCARARSLRRRCRRCSRPSSHPPSASRRRRRSSSLTWTRALPAST